MQDLQRAKECPAGILNGSGDTESCRAVLAGLRQALPENEFDAVAAWVSTFYGYQQKWLLDWSRFSLLVKSRQIGASHTYGGAASLWGVLGEGTSIVSIGEREASEVLDKIHLHCQALTRLGSRWASVVSKNATEIVLGSGAKIVSLPSTSGPRGRSANVLLDEAAYLPFAKKTWDAASASVMHGFKLRVMSTPNGAIGLFYDLWSNEIAHRGYSLHAVKIYEAIADGLKINIDECWKMALGDPRLFDQLFCCSFLDNQFQYIPTEIIQACANTPYLVRDLPPGPHFAGLDIGRENDRTVLVVLREVNGVRYVVFVASMKRTDSDGLEKMVADAFERFKLRQLCVDATGLGAFPAERMKTRHSLVEPFDFTNASKEELITSLYASMRDRKLALPPKDGIGEQIEPGAADAIQRDLSAIQRIVTSAGLVRYDAPRTSEGHADHAWAVALADRAASTAPTSVPARTTPRSGSRWGDNERGY